MANTNTTPKVSIIITTYNGAKHITETIESIRNQSWKNWELIIIDDGSDDNTCEIITDIKDERIFLYRAGRVGINGRLKNIGLEKASGELIAFIDHDDLWHPLELEKQIMALREYSEAGFCLTGGYNFKKKETPFEFFYSQKEGARLDNVFLDIFMSKIALWTQAMLLRRDCLKSTGVFSETGRFADPEFICRVAYYCKAV